jgi:hypothetical protein
VVNLGSNAVASTLPAGGALVLAAWPPGSACYGRSRK